MAELKKFPAFPSASLGSEKPGLGANVVRKSLSRQLYEALEQAIIDGRIAPGTRLGEDGIAAAFSVSRSPAREAIAELERLGLAERLPNRDRRVTVPSAAFIHDIYDVWALLESERLYAASCHASDEVLKNVDRLLSQMEACHAVGDFAADNRLLPEFHDALQRECPNRQLQRVSTDWTKYIRWFRSLYFDYSNDSADQAIEEHRRIVEYFRRRDREGLTRVMREHIYWQRDRVLTGWRSSTAPELASSNRVLDFTLPA